MLEAAVEFLKTKMQQMTKQNRDIKRDNNDMRIKVLDSTKKFKKFDNRITMLEEGIEMPELDDLLVEGKEIDTKVIIGLMKNMQRDILAKCVSDTKLQPI